ncbi:hypothetical protein BDF14DRAFT_1757784, partial [Spinellus fusiger]
IFDPCNDVLINDLQGFCLYSASKFNECLNKKNLFKIATDPARKLHIIYGRKIAWNLRKPASILRSLYFYIDIIFSTGSK